MSLLFSGALFGFNYSYVPAANRKQDALRAEIKGRPKQTYLNPDRTWIMGNDYRVKSAYYGGYPAGYLRRIRALFPDKRRVLHLFSGKVEVSAKLCSPDGLKMTRIPRRNKAAYAEARRWRWGDAVRLN